MSAPAMKVFPPPMMTMARAEGSFSAASNAATRPSGTPGLRAFTGGLLMVMTATPSCVVRFTRFSIVVERRPLAYARGLETTTVRKWPYRLYCGGNPDQRRARHATQDTAIRQRE